MSLLSPEFLSYLERLDLLIKRSIKGASVGERLSSKYGRGIEFEDYRSYEIGDDFRYIDWNIYARLDKLFVKLFREEEMGSINIFLDISRSMDFGNPSKLYFGKQLAASLGYIGLVNYDSVNIYCISSTVEKKMESIRGRSSVIRLLRFLDEADSQGVTSLTGAIRESVKRLKSKAIFIVLSDFLDPAGYEDGLKLLKSRGYGVFAFHILSEDEISPDISGDVKLIDSETGEVIELDALEDVLDGYKKTLERFLAEVESFCLTHSIEYIRASSSIPVDRIILYYMRLGGWLR